MKKNPPIDDQLIEFQFPSFKKETLRNGLTVLGLESSSPVRSSKLSKIYFRLAIDFGEKNDPPSREGTIELLARVLKKGTASRSYQEIVEEIDFTGGNLGIDSSPDIFYLSGSFLREYSDVGLELISDVLLNPAFDQSEIEKERKKILANIENEKSSPSFLAHRRFKKVLYSAHPYSRSKTPQSIREINRETVLEIYRKFVSPVNACLIATGDISFDETVVKANKYFGRWHRDEEAKHPAFSLPEVSGKRKVYLVDRPASEQCNILLGTLLFSRKSREFEAFQVMNKILGGGSSGRLFIKLREEKGFTYGAYSAMVCLKETGDWQATADVRNEVTGAAIDTFLEEFAELQTKSVSDEELKNAKRYLIGSFPVKNETPAAIASLELQRQLHDLPEDYWNNYLKMIDRISKNDVNEMAMRYLDIQKMPIVLVGDANKIRKQLGKFAEIEMYNLDDERID
jgi:zinc protease